MTVLADLRALSELSNAQSGFFTTSQAQARGVQPATLTRLLKAEIITRPQRAIYRMAAAPESELEYEDIYAAWLATDPAKPGWERLRYNPDEVIAAGALALKLFGDPILNLPKFDFVSAQRRQSRDPRIRFRLRSLEIDEVTTIRGIPAMTIERAIADIFDLNVDLSTIEAVAEAQILDGTTTALDVINAINAIRPPAQRSHQENLFVQTLSTVSSH